MYKRCLCIFLFLALIWATPTSAVKIAHYTFEEGSGNTVYDTSGNGFDGTIDGVDWTEGYYGSGLEFDGSSYVELPGEDMGLTAETGSVAFWVNSDEPDTIYTLFWGGDNTTGGGFGDENELHIHLEQAADDVWAGGEVGFYIEGTGHLASDPDSAIGSAPVNPTQINDEQWHHIVCIWDDGDMSMYIDGEFIHSDDGSTVDFEMTYIYLGQMASGTRYFTGLMDDVQIYNHALTETEVQLAMAGGVDPALPSAPSPADGEEDVALDSDLSWTPGIYADSHDVYFGTNFDEVNEADRDNPGSVLVSPGQTDALYSPEELALDGIYYWRIDEVNEDPQDGIYRGEVWSFSAESTYIQAVPIAATASSSDSEESGDPNQTYDSNGLDESDLHSAETSEMWKTAEGEIEGAWIQYEFESTQKLSSLLVWNFNGDYESILGIGIKEATIETSLDGETWTDLAGTLTFNRGTGLDGYAANTTIDMGGVMAKYVKIIVISHWSALPTVTQVGLSELRFMAIPAAARLPEPSPGSTLDSLYGELVWRAGRGAEQHQLYLDVNEALITAGDDSVLISTTTERRFDLSDADLQYNATYYWKVVEVTEEEIVDGSTWSFSTPAYLVIDDMESYNDNEDHRIFDAWDDGYGDDNDNGSQVGHTTAPYSESEIIFEGSLSMPFYYDTTNGESDSWAELTLDSQNWIDGGIKELSLFFLGERGNDEAELYLRINDTTIPSTASLNSGLWRQWIINLSTVGTNLSSVNSITIGVDGEDVEGTLYFDNIRLYCEAPVVATAEPENPGDTNLELYMDMEGDLLDSTSHGRNGTSDSTPYFEESLIEGEVNLGEALELNGVDYFVDLNEPVADLVASLSDSTFAIWVQLEDDSDSSWQRAFDFGMDSSTYMFLSPRNDTSGPPEFGIALDSSDNEYDVAGTNALTSGWHHLAVVIEAAEPNSALSLYVDGVVVDTDTTDTLPQDLGATTNNWLGRSQFSADGYFAGLMDEFRIYSRALTAGEIRYLAGER